MSAETNNTDRSWLSDAKNDITAWSEVMPLDADEKPIDWDWVRSLDLEHGIGHAPDDFPHDESSPDVHDLLRRDYMVRERLEPILARCNRAFMTDFDRVLDSYRLARALAYANRRLNDEILYLIDRGVDEGLWTASAARKGGATIQVLSPAGDDRPLSDVIDRTGDILNARARRRRAQRKMEEARLSAATPDATHDESPKRSWRDAYLPGRDVDHVLGIDIETTGIDPARVYIIDVGSEHMNMISPKPADATGTYRYEQHHYEQGDAYGQSRLSFGVPELAARRGNPVIADLTGIDIRTRGPESGLQILDDRPDAQRELLDGLERQPYVAHNAAFEHGFFMLTIDGYAESYRDGRITIIDTMLMSQRWDPGSKPGANHPYPNNRLDSYAKRQGILTADQSERHLGLEDAHIMLMAMKHHLTTLRAENQGPWGPEGEPGTGGKHCKKYQ